VVWCMLALAFANYAIDQTGTEETL
jgi:hypothetical protein